MFLSENGDCRPIEESIDVIGEADEFGESAVIVPERFLFGGGGVKTRSRRELKGVEELDWTEGVGCLGLGGT